MQPSTKAELIVGILLSIIIVGGFALIMYLQCGGHIGGCYGPM